MRALVARQRADGSWNTDTDIGPIGMGGMAMGNTVMRDRAFRVLLDILESGDFNRTYFPSTVGLLNLLALSGNFPTP